MISDLILIAVVLALLLYIIKDIFDGPDDPDDCHLEDPLCCGGGCHV